MADVSSMGEVITCGYDKGIEPGWQIPSSKDDGYLEVKLFDVGGELIWSQAIRRQVGMQMHGHPLPYCSQVFIQNYTNHAFFNLHTKPFESQLYSLDMRQPGSLEQKSFDLSKAHEATFFKDIHFKTIENSNLILAEITGNSYEESPNGTTKYGYLSDALFYLFENNGEILWHKSLLGSLDIRHAAGEIDAVKVFLKQQYLLTINHQDQQFSIVDFKEKQQHNYQIMAQKTVKFINTEPFRFEPFKFNKANEQINTPLLTQTIHLNHLDKENSCKNRFDAIDSLSNGTLLLFNKDSFRLTLYPNLNEPPNVIQLDKSLKHTKFITGEAMFVGDHNQIYVNLGLANFALLNNKGQFQHTIDLDKACQEYCLEDWVAQKSSPQFWQKSYGQGFTLVDINNKTIKTAHKDNNGYWIEYIYTMKSDSQGRLLALGRTEDTFNKFYLFDHNGQAITTFDLGFGYSTTVTVRNDSIYLSQEKSHEILQFNLSGELTGTIQTPNHVHQLHATNQYLFAVTDDAILVYALPD